MSACNVPAGSTFVPIPTVAGAILTTESDGAGGFRPVWLPPPQTPNNQNLEYGNGGPFWANTGGLALKQKGVSSPP